MSLSVEFSYFEISQAEACFQMSENIKESENLYSLASLEESSRVHSLSVMEMALPGLVP